MINLFLPESPTRRADDASNLAITGAYGPLSDFWYNAIGRPTASKVRVTEETALTYSACWAATRLLSGTAGMLPLNLYQRRGADDETDDDTESNEYILRDDPRNRLVEHRPNEEMSASMWKAQAFRQQINAGNCYSEIERDGRGNGVAYWPIHESRVRLIRDAKTDRLNYEVKNGIGEELTYIEPADMLHVPSMMSDDGMRGKGVITYARETVGFGLVTERYGAAYFGSGGIPRIVITHPGKMGADARTNFRKEWKEIYGGADGDKVALVSEGGQVVPINISNDDAQFLLTRQHNIEEIARWYGVSQHLIQVSTRATNSNMEQMGIEFVQYGLLPWLKLWEQELWAKLLTPAEQSTMYFRFNVTELLRGDSKTRSEYIRTLVQIGVMTPDEGRIMEGLNPEGGAAAGLFMQGAMMPIDKLGQQPPPALPKIPGNSDEQKGTDTQTSTATFLRAVIEQGQQMETRVSAAIATSANGLREDFQRRIEATKPVALLPAPEPKAEEPDVRGPAFLAAAKVMLLDAADRLVRKEVWAARQAAKSPATFLVWLDKFYGGEYPQLCEKLFAPACSMLLLVGVPASAGQLASTGAAESRDALLTLSGSCGAADLADKVEGLVSQWEKSGAQAIADSVVGDQT